MVFREEAEVEEQCTHPMGLFSEKAQLSSLQVGLGDVNVQEPEAQVLRARDVEMALGDPGPSVSEAAPTMDLLNKDGDMSALWCRIVEEPPDE